MTQTAVNYGRVRRLAEELLGSQVKPPVQLSPIINSLDAELRILELAPDISGILYRARGPRAGSNPPLWRRNQPHMTFSRAPTPATAAIVLRSS